MSYNYEYEDYCERKHNLRFDVIAVIAKSEERKRIKKENETNDKSN